MTEDRTYQNAVLDDLELQAALKFINPKFGDFVTRVAGEAWGLPLIDQKTKALITIAVDVVSQDHKGIGNAFAAHVNMALKQGGTRAEIEELLVFMCIYAGFNKVAGCFGILNEIFEQSNVDPRKAAMISAIKKVDYALRDQNGKAVFYVLLWKRKSITLDLFDEYWRNVHGPVCARLPGQHQYWQFHLAHNQGDLWPTIDGIEYTSRSEDQFDGIAELTFETEADRQTWFKAAAILMDDEHNLFRKAIGYNSSPGNSKTYVDGIPTGNPNGKQGILKFHVMVKKSNAVSVDEFRKYMTNSFACAVVESDWVLKFRLHLFEELDNSRPDAVGVIHNEPSDKQYQAAFEIAFSNALEMETFFASQEYTKAVKDLAKYVKQFLPFPERTAYTFVYDGNMTLAGQRSSKVAELIQKVGATNQLNSDIISLMSGKQTNGEQLEFNQVTDQVKEHFAKPQSEYNEVNETSFAVSDAKVSSLTTKQERAMLERIPGTATEMVKQLILRFEAFDYDGVIPFFTDTPVYQFGNFEVCLDKAAMKKAAEAFFSQISAVSHEIKMMWEVGNVVFAEMDIIYRRKYGSVISLPCCNIFRLEGDKFSELRVFMDVNPLFDPTIVVSDTASVFTVSQGKKLISPHIIQSFFAEHAQGIKR